MPAYTMTLLAGTQITCRHIILLAGMYYGFTCRYTNYMPVYLYIYRHVR